VNPKPVRNFVYPHCCCHPDAESLDREILLNQSLALHWEKLKLSAQQLLETPLHQSGASGI
jgi:hypothetical protein